MVTLPLSQPAVTARPRRRNRQRIRRGLQLAAMLLFPVTMNAFSPFISVVSASVGVVSASLVTFAMMLLGSLILGRLWCGWGCPAGAIQDLCTGIRERPAPDGKWNLVKWAIWVPWFASIVAGVYAAGGFQSVDLLYMTESGVSVDEPLKFVAYYGVVAAFVVPALFFGRRGGCHYLCWMAPFMIVGRKLGDTLRLPGLRLAADADHCTSCGKCTNVCPTGLDVRRLVQLPTMANSECVLCGCCVDTCPKQAIRYRFGVER